MAKEGNLPLRIIQVIRHAEQEALCSTQVKPETQDGIKSVCNTSLISDGDSSFTSCRACAKVSMDSLIPKPILPAYNITVGLFNVYEFF